jgi:hypothetical protein
MSAILPFGLLAVHQAKIDFVDERGRLQGMVAALPGKIPLRDPPQLVVDKRDEGISGLNIALAPAGQQFGDALASILSAQSIPQVQSHSVSYGQRVLLIFS